MPGLSFRSGFGTLILIPYTVARRPSTVCTLRETSSEAAATADLVERLMGKDPAHRFAFIQANAKAIEAEEIDA